MECFSSFWLGLFDWTLCEGACVLWLVWFVLFGVTSFEVASALLQAVGIPCIL